MSKKQEMFNIDREWSKHYKSVPNYTKAQTEAKFTQAFSTSSRRFVNVLKGIQTIIN